MIAALKQNPEVNVDVSHEVSFVDRHFTKIAFAVAAFVHFILSPFFIILGSALSLTAHLHFQTELKLRQEDQIITVSHAVFAIVGATAAAISVTPAGALGGVVFQLVPLLSYFSIGSALHRAVTPIMNYYFDPVS